MTSPDTEIIRILGATSGKGEAPPPKPASKSLPSAVPILGLADIVIFPGMVAPLLVDTPQSVRLVDDVVEGIILAAGRGLVGKAYNLGGEDATLEQYLGVVASLTGVQRRVFAISPGLMVPVVHLCQLWGRLGGATSLTPAWLNHFLEDRPVDISSAVGDLGYAPRGLREGLRQTLAWLTFAGEGAENEFPEQGPARYQPHRLRPPREWY